MSAEEKSRVGTVIRTINPSLDTSSAMDPDQKPEPFSSGLSQDESVISDESLSQFPANLAQDESTASAADENLNQLLADLALNVPPVPESFRRNWRQAVRQEADAVREPNVQFNHPSPDIMQKVTGQSSLSGSPAQNDAEQSASSIARNADRQFDLSSGALSQEDAPSAPKSDNVVRIHPRISTKPRFRRFLTVAAMAFFLLGGAMLTRPSLFISPQKTAPALLAFSSVPSSPSDEIAALETVEEEEETFDAAMEEAAFEATEEEGAAFEIVEEKKAAFNAAGTVETAFETAVEEAAFGAATEEEPDGKAAAEEETAFIAAPPEATKGSQIQSNKPATDTAGEIRNQGSGPSQSVFINPESSDMDSEFNYEEASAANEVFDTGSVSQKTEPITLQRTESASSSNSSSQARLLQVLGIILLVLALVLFLLRRRI